VRFLADESCDFAVVRALRTAGHDVVAVAEVQEGAPDETVVALALEGSYVLLTEDRDFGRLVYASGLPSAGVLYMRFPARARQMLATAVVQFVDRTGERLADSFVVLQPGRVRVSRRP
jgi:predicted nuclease of predicted toxin-antitoxin system